MFHFDINYFILYRLDIIIGKQKSINKKKSIAHSNAPPVYTSLAENRVKYDKQIDLPNPKLQPDKTFEYAL
jgi:hypothetical protein